MVDAGQWLQVGSIVSGFVIVAWQMKSAKDREIDFKIHQQRKEQYMKLLEIIKDIFVASKTSDPKKGFNFDQNRWLEVQFGQSLYASQDVLRAYWDLIEASKRDPLMSIKKLGDLILIMRKEVGFDDSDLPARQLLSSFINDINEEKYDYIFK